MGGFSEEGFKLGWNGGKYCWCFSKLKDGTL